MCDTKLDQESSAMKYSQYGLILIRCASSVIVLKKRSPARDSILSAALVVLTSIQNGCRLATMKKVRVKDLEPLDVFNAVRGSSYANLPDVAFAKDVVVKFREKKRLSLIVRTQAYDILSSLAERFWTASLRNIGYL